MARRREDALRDPARLRAVARGRALVDGRNPSFDRLAELAARATGVPVVLIELVGDDEQSVVGCSGLEESWASRRALPVSWGLGAEVVAGGKPVLVDDQASDPARSGDPSVSGLGAAAQACFPLAGADGQVIGVLTAIDHRPRAWGERDRRVLAAAAVCVLDLVELRAEMGQRLRAWERGQRRSQQRLLLGRIMEAMGDTGEPDAELQVLTDMVVPVVADACAVYRLARPAVAGGGGVAMRRVAYAQADRLAVPMGSPEGEIVMPGDDPITEAVSTARTVVVTDRPPEPPGWVAILGADKWYRVNRPSTVTVVPIEARGEVVAVLAMTICAGRPAFDREDLALVEEVTRQAARMVEEGLRHEQAEQTALRFQLSLLADPPRLPDAAVEVRYRPASRDAEVGGDWYDAFLLPDGDLVVVIGDVVGHDLAAAVTMGQLRSMLRALACDNARHGPGAWLSRLARLNDTLAVTELTTVLVARLGRSSAPGALTWANAGHLPPLILEPGGRTRLLGDHGALPIGVTAESGVPTVKARLAAGSTLLLYTDGLVETRTEGVDKGIARLAERAASRWRLPLGDLCDDLVRGLGAGGEDDVALLALRTEAVVGAGAAAGPAVPVPAVGALPAVGRAPVARGS